MATNGFSNANGSVENGDNGPYIAPVSNIKNYLYDKYVLHIVKV